MAKVKRKTRTRKKSLPARKKSRTSRSDHTEALKQELKEALKQQTATSEILRVIASSPTELQPVLDTVIENAVRLAGATQGHIRQFDGEFLQLVASYGETPEEVAILRAASVRPDSSRTTPSREALRKICAPRFYVWSCAHAATSVARKRFAGLKRSQR